MTGEEMRDQLADRLADWTYRGRNMTGPEACSYADALLPVVRKIAAAELRAAARGLSNPHEQAWIEARAHALDPS